VDVALLWGAPLDVIKLLAPEVRPSLCCWLSSARLSGDGGLGSLS